MRRKQDTTLLYLHGSTILTMTTKYEKHKILLVLTATMDQFRARASLRAKVRHFNTNTPNDSSK